MSPQKENVKGASAPNSELPEQSGETLPDGGDIGVAELRALAAENAAADEAELRTAYEQVFTALVEIPAAWATFTPADRQGALQVGWLRLLRELPSAERPQFGVRARAGPGMAGR